MTTLKAFRAALILLAAASFVAAAGWPHQGKYGPNTRRFLIKNFLGKDLRVGVLSGGDSPLKQDDFPLKARKDTSYETPNVWPAARIWARVDGNAPGPFTLAEFTLGKQDYYDVSLVDGFNLPVTISAVPGTYTRTNPNDPYQCGSGGCAADLLATCPEELARKDSSGKAATCLSACTRFDTDEYCCRGAYGTPQTCRPAAWPVDYPRIFKQACPTAYSYAYDDPTSTFLCPADPKTGAGPDYVVAFGVAPSSIRDGRLALASARGGTFEVTVTGKVLRWGGLAARESGRIAVYGADGGMLAEAAAGAEPGSLPLPGSPSGKYILVLKSGGGMWTALLEGGRFTASW